MALKFDRKFIFSPMWCLASREFLLDRRKHRDRINQLLLGSSVAECKGFRDSKPCGLLRFYAVCEGAC